MYTHSKMRKIMEASYTLISSHGQPFENPFYRDDVAITTAVNVNGGKTRENEQIPCLESNTFHIPHIILLPFSIHLGRINKV